jgi:preprotein translocase subunit SecF
VWSYIALANSILMLVLLYGTVQLYKHKKDKLFINVSGCLFIMCSVGFFETYHQYKMEQTHEIEMTFKYIDQMNPLELKNKLKTCMINQSNCTFVFVEQ